MSIWIEYNNYVFPDWSRNVLYMLHYEVVDDYVVRRAPFREHHLNLANDASHRGELLLGGALADPVDGAVLVFANEMAAIAFANNDPYVQNGIVAKWTVRKWTVVAGRLLESALNRT